MAVQQPHDKYFKELMSQKEQAKSFIKEYLPESIVLLIDLESVELVKNSFVSEDLSEFYSDLIYKVNVKNQPAYIYTLFDHKSSPEKNVTLQLLKYMTLLLEEEVKKNPKWKKLPAIIPIVFYHGKPKWDVAISLKELYIQQEKELEPFLLDFKYYLCDLSNYDDSEIKGEILLQVSLLTFKHIFDKRENWKDVLPRITKLLSELGESDHVLNYIRVYLTYLMDRAEVSKDDVKQMIESSFPNKGGELFMTPAQELRLEGKAEGEQIGKLKGEIELAEKFYEQGKITQKEYNELVEPLKAKLKDFEDKSKL